MNDSNSAHEHYLRALDLEEADKLAAKSAYEACLAGDCSHLEARINLGRLLHLAGMHREAETVYRDTQVADATLFFNLAVLLEDSGREVEAIRYYQRAIMHDPGLADAHFNLSVLEEKNGETQSAYRHLLAYHRLIKAHQTPANFEHSEADETPSPER